MSTIKCNKCGYVESGKAGVACPSCEGTMESIVQYKKLVLLNPVLQWLNPFIDSPFYYSRKYEKELIAACGPEEELSKSPFWCVEGTRIDECTAEEAKDWNAKINSVFVSGLYTEEVMKNLVFVSRAAITFDFLTTDFKVMFNKLSVEDKALSFSMMFMEVLSRRAENFIMFCDGTNLYITHG